MIRNNSRDPLICEDDFKGKVVMISGATAGIGKLTAHKFASMGARLVCINRNPVKSQALKEEIEGQYGTVCNNIIADLGVYQDVLRAAEELKAMDEPIDVLIHNAGIFLTRQEYTLEGIDKVFMVHHLSAFMLNILLADKLRSQEEARIILVSSEGHRFVPWGLHLDDLNWEKHRYTGLKSYGSAKLAQLQTMLIFDEHFRDSGVSIIAMHPGAVRSETGQENGRGYRRFKKHIMDRMLRPTDISSEAIYYLAAAKEMKGVSGKFFNLTMEEDPAPPAVDREAAAETWARSIELTRMKDPVSGA